MPVLPLACVDPNISGVPGPPVDVETRIVAGEIGMIGDQNGTSSRNAGGSPP